MLTRLTFPTLCLVLALSASGLAVPGAQDATTRQYIVGFYSMPALERGDAYLGEPVVDLDEPLRFVVVETRDPVAFEARARLDGNVRYLEVNDPFYARALYSPNDPLYSNNGHWGTKKIGAQTAWDRTLGVTSVKVAVIDSGLRRTHEEFAGQSRVLAGYDTISEDNDPQDTCGHGTHVTGTIAATINNAKGIAGLAQVTVYPIRGLTASLIDCTGSAADLAQGLRRAGDEGAHFSSNSWGGGGSSSITDAISYAHGKGVTQVAAAGNDGSCSNCVNEPWRSNAEKVIVVSSTTSNDGFSSFSSQGPQVDVAAPGSGIISSYSSNDASYSTLSGTSMAAPHVTGTAALIKSLNPSWGYAQIDNQLKVTAVDLGASGRDDRFGHGRINAAAAVVVGTPASNVAPTACFTAVTSGGTVTVDGTCSSDADGTIGTWSWNWGDSTTSTGATASHTYAASGTYVITLTVTDDDAATASAVDTVSVTVAADPDPSTPTLPLTGLTATSGAAGTDQWYKISVPSDRAVLRVVLDGPACGVPCVPNLDLSVRYAARPTDTTSDCSAATPSSDENCLLADPAAGWWYVRVHVTAGSNAAYSLWYAFV